MSVYVAVTEPGCERRAVRWLLEHGVPAFAPMSRVFRRAGHRKAIFDLPILSQYVFVMIDGSAEARAAVVRCRYVRRLDETRFDAGRECRLGGVDGVVHPVDWLTCVLVWQSFGLFDRTLVRRPSYRIGQLVRLIQGIFQGCVGRVVGEGRRGKVEVRVEGRFIHGKVAVDPSGIVDAETKAA